MSYEVLARKWRPADFSEMVGQDHVLRALSNALDSDRLHHAYLFTGTRGVGKTTISRILAKSLNCEKGVSSQPCGECHACKEIAEGRFIDLVEVDAASRTKVDDTRELLDNVQYTPTSGRFKIYLIDEVHMLSKHSFNALLKTLEEPPPHVKFLFATTDYDKIPATILSRCLQFNLKRIPVDMIAAHLRTILDKEDIPYDAPALDALANTADGSIRDALSLMDQAIAFGNGSVNESDVNSMLGTIPRHKLYQVLQNLASGDANQVLESIDDFDEMAPDYDAALAEVISLFHHIAVIKEVPGSAESRFFDRADELVALADAFASEDIQLFYDICIRARRDMPYIKNKKQGFEMTLLRMLSFSLGPVNETVTPVNADNPPHKQRSTENKTVTKTPSAAQASSISSIREPGGHYDETATSTSTKNKNTNDEPSQQATSLEKEETAVKVDHIITDWKQCILDMKLTGMPKAFAEFCELISSEPGVVKLLVSEQHDVLHNADVERIIRESLEALHGQKTRLIIKKTSSETNNPAKEVRQQKETRQRSAEQSIESDPLVQTLSSTFNAKIIEGSIKGVIK